MVSCDPITVKSHKLHETPKLRFFLTRLAVVFAQYIEAKCSVENEDVVGATPISEWSIISLPTKVHLTVYIYDLEQDCSTQLLTHWSYCSIALRRLYICQGLHRISPCVSLAALGTKKQQEGQIWIGLQWHWLCGLGQSLSFKWKDFNYSCHVSGEEWKEL